MLAAHIAEYKLATVEIAKNYGQEQFREDLKKVCTFNSAMACISRVLRRLSRPSQALMGAGAKQENTVFLLSDTQIVRESFLEDINNLLNAGDIPNIWAPDESVTCAHAHRAYLPAPMVQELMPVLHRALRLDHIVELVRPLAKAAGRGQGRDDVLAYFVACTRARLHVILCPRPHQP